MFFALLLFLPSCIVLGEQFRMEKLNFVWSKVDQNSVDPARIDKFRIDLNRFDKLYLSEKQDGEHEKKKSASLDEIDRKLEQLLDRYDLDGALRAFRIKYKYEKSKIYAENSDNSVKNDKSAVFRDARLMRLWNHAKSNDDLLSEELEHVFENAKGLDDKISTYSRLTASHNAQRSNHVDEDEEHDTMAVKLKKLNQDIESQLQDLDDVVSGAKENPFTLKQARKLWIQVLSVKTLSKDDLKLFRSDIRQYEKQLMRVAHHQGVLDDAKSVSKTQFKDKDDTFHDEEVSDLLVDQDKLEKKAKKLESWLTDRIKAVAVKDHQEL